MLSNITIFERPLPKGWVYPCSTGDIQARLSLLPTQDLQRLRAVGLVPATRKDCRANGRYRPGAKPTIYLYSIRDTLTYRQPAHVSRADIEHGLAVEIAYGMRFDRIGSRFVCRWEVDDYRRFMVEYVLLHEVGHHVCRRQRSQQGLLSPLNTTASEQYAEAYARRHAA